MESIVFILIFPTFKKKIPAFFYIIPEKNDFFVVKCLKSKKVKQKTPF